MSRILRVFVAGLVAALPLAVTIFVVGWMLAGINEYAGPSSAFGRYLISLGLGVGTLASYLIGLALIVGAVYLLGLVIESRLGAWARRLVERVIGRMPIVSSIYDLSSRVVSVIGATDGDTNLTDMKPVWCYFGGKPGAAVLALMPTPRPTVLGEINYLGILIPTAPVPFGGALIYVPETWVEPAVGHVDDLISVYVSMGLTPPRTEESDDKPKPESA